MHVHHPHTRSFRLIMWARIWYGFLRILLGLALVRYIGVSLGALIFMLMGHEFVGEKHDFLLKVLAPLSAHFHYPVTYFAAAYLLFWGLLDVILSGLLLQSKLFAYPLSIMLISSFMMYELFRLLHTHSVILAGFIFCDLVAIWLIWREYQKLEHHEIPESVTT